jgi:pyruvate formate lyase activating enzyme
MIKPAAYWEKLEDGKVICKLCPAECRLTDGKVGICRSRFNRDGELVTDNYGELVSLAIDPIEKKPLYHFYPAADILSTGPNSCNLGCMHCQNWTISQRKAETTFFSPEQLVETAIQYKSLGVAFTYTEPMVWYEYIMDTAPLLRRASLKTVLVSCGYINPEPLEDLLGVMDAINIDLKSMRADFYKKICKGKLEPVLRNIRRVAESSVHLEVTNLIIPTLNDSDQDLNDLVDFVASLSDMIPLHFSAYRPDYKLTIKATPIDTMLRAREIARKKLKYVYLGNVLLEGSANTLCPNCGNLLIQRSGYYTSVVGLKEGCCAACGFKTGVIQ